MWDEDGEAGVRVGVQRDEVGYRARLEGNQNGCFVVVL